MNLHIGGAFQGQEEAFIFHLRFTASMSEQDPIRHSAHCAKKFPQKMIFFEKIIFLNKEKYENTILT